MLPSCNLVSVTCCLVSYHLFISIVQWTAAAANSVDSCVRVRTD